MNKLIVFFVLVSISLICCDGRDRKHKTNEEVLKENKLLDSFRTVVKYIPETYTEISKDTILKNGFRVKIKTYTEMQSNVLNEFTIDTIRHKFYYRNYTSKLNIVYKNSLILEETINKSYLNKNDNKKFWDFAIMGGVYIDEQKSVNNKVHIGILYCIPESEICKSFEIIADNKGNRSIKELETAAIH